MTTARPPAVHHALTKDPWTLQNNGKGRRSATTVAYTVPKMDTSSTGPPPQLRRVEAGMKRSCSRLGHRRAYLAQTAAYSRRTVNSLFFSTLRSEHSRIDSLDGVNHAFGNITCILSSAVEALAT